VKQLENEHIDMIIDAGVKNVILHKEGVNLSDFALVYNTLTKRYYQFRKGSRRVYLSLACVMQILPMMKPPGE
jgi:hypothetical protein